MSIDIWISTQGQVHLITWHTTHLYHNIFWLSYEGWLIYKWLVKLNLLRPEAQLKEQQRNQHRTSKHMVGMLLGVQLAIWNIAVTDPN